MRICTGKGTKHQFRKKITVDLRRKPKHENAQNDGQWNEHKIDTATCLIEKTRQSVGGGPMTIK